jgi:hypothetical protein
MRTRTDMAKPTVAVPELSNSHTSKRRRMYNSALVARNLMFAHWFSCSKTRQHGRIWNISNTVSEAVDQQSQCNREIFRLSPETRLASVDIRFRNKDALLQNANTPEQRTPDTDPRVPLLISAYANVKIRITESNTPEQRRQPYTRGHKMHERV